MTSWCNLLDSNFFGALTGAGITGIITILIFLYDKKSLKDSRNLERENMRSNYRVFYRTKSKTIIESASGILFFLSLLDRNHHYNIEPVDEISHSLNEIKKNSISLIDSNLDFVAPDVYELTESIMDYVNRMNKNFEGILATEEEELFQSIDLLRSNSEELINLIQENVLTKEN